MKASMTKVRHVFSLWRKSLPLLAFHWALFGTLHLDITWGLLYLTFGPHIGTRTYEVGALFDLHHEDDEAHFELSDQDIRLETSNNIDLTFRKHEGNLGIILNAFFNKVDDYYFQNDTGYFAESGHDHEDEHDHDHDADMDADEDEHAGELPIFLLNSTTAVTCHEPRRSDLAPISIIPITA